MLETKQPWPLNAWYQAAWNSEIGDKPLGRKLLNQDIVLYRGRDGKVAALEDRCCHRAAALSMGSIVDKGLQCDYHGLVYDGTGKCVHIPNQDTIPPQACVRAYPIVEKNEFVWIWMGDPAKADESQIIDYPWNDDHKNWPHKHGMSYIKCNYMLVVDNLMDLTHIPYIHKRTIGGGAAPSTHTEALMDTKRTERGVHFIRWMLGVTPPPTYVKGAGFAPGVKVDRWFEGEYVVPSSIIQWSGALPVGQGAQQNRDQPGGFSARVYHGATPETENTCFYFWTPANGYRQNEPRATEDLYNEIVATFVEDIAFLEVQDSRIYADRKRPLVDIVSDKNRIHARRTMERMIRAETGEHEPAMAAE
ncbi:MAG: Rieske 2Fe-2S domain-containing protein [Alphaproteobacteria bacterium]